MIEAGIIYLVLLVVYCWFIGLLSRLVFMRLYARYAVPVLSSPALPKTQENQNENEK